MDSSAHKPGIARSDIVVAAALEAGGARLGRRLMRGRTCPECGARLAGRRPLRRLIGAMVVEVILDGLVAEAFVLNRKRTQARTVAGVAPQRPVPPAAQRHVSVPQQRTAPQPTGTPLAVRSVP